MSEREVYLIVYNGKFYNAKEKYFCEKMHLATLYESFKKANDVLVMHFLKDCEVVKITEKEFMDNLMVCTTNVVISLEVTSSYLKRYQCKQTTIYTYKKLKQ